MAKKKAKKKRPEDRAWTCDIQYTNLDKDAIKKQQAANKKMWDSVHKRERQLDRIIALLERIEKRGKK